MSERSSYSLEKAYEEAANMQDKIKSGKAENYTEAEILVDNEKEKLSQKEKDFSQCFLQIEIKLKPEEEKEEIITFSQEEIEKLAQEQFLLDYNSQTLLAIIPERFKRNAENFEITLGEWKKAALIRPQLLIQKPETLEANIIESANRFNVSKESFVKAALDQPQLFIKKPETLEANIIESANRFNVSKESFVKAALDRPQLFSQKPETSESNIIESARRFNVSKEAFIKAALEQSTLFTQKPETSESNIIESARRFNISKEAFVKAALDKPQLFYQKPETLEANIIESARRFNVSKEVFVKAALGLPPLFTQKPETLEANIIESARRFNVSKEVFGEAALKQPQLFCQKPETLEANIIESARKLEIDKEVFIGMSLNNPVLFSSSPQTLKNKFDLKSRLLFLDDDETRKRIVARPNSLNYSPERDILHYLAKKITGKEKINFSKSPIEIISDYFLEREDAESAQQWQRAARYFDALSKKKRKIIRRNIKRKEKEGIQPGYTETDLYRNLIVFSEEYFGEKSDSLTDAEIQKIQELVDKVVRHLEEKKEINLASRP